eukprot:TRINITY_DN21030_c0_g1_i1.p1 TRINITY_DN21030_c0_g1~~TRINITY_DN21030_c0_g1_i1.p1  ORF type:complete len:601 (+),score=181.37 TRINITY_DN21030_c0_g1_i1:2302-4104(+)
MEEFNPDGGDDMGTLRWENSALRTQIGVMETELLRLNELTGELTRGMQTRQTKMVGLQNAAKVAEENAAEMASQIEVQRLVNKSLTSMVSSPGSAGDGVNINNELLPAQRVDWVDRLYSVLSDVDTGTGVDLELVRRTLVLHNPSLNWEAMVSIMSHVRESASRGSIGLGDFYWWVVVALQGAHLNDAMFVECMRHLVTGTCRSVISTSLFNQSDLHIPQSQRDGYVDAVLACFTRIAKGEMHSGVQYWVIQGGVPLVEGLTSTISHPETQREFDPCDLIGLSVFSKWVSGCVRQNDDASGGAPAENGGALVDVMEFVSRMELVQAAAMGAIVKGPVRGEDGQVVLAGKEGVSAMRETPDCYSKLLKVAKSRAPDKKWEVKHEDDIIRVESLDLKVVLVRAVLLLKNITPDLALKVLLDTSVRTKWDPVLEHVEVLDPEGAFEDANFSFDFDVETLYVYMRIQKQMGVKARDCLQRWKVCRNDMMTGAHLVLIEDAQHRDRPEDKNYVRMTTHIGGYILAPEGDDSCRMTIINQTGVGGNVPTSMVNAFAIKAPVMWQGKVIRACKKYCLLYTSDAADEEDSVDLGGRRIIKKKKDRKVT